MPTRALHFVLPVASEDLLQGYLLTHFEIEGIEEASDGSMICYIPEAAWTDDARRELDEFLAQHPDMTCTGAELVQERDWNADWESSIEPQRITDELTITPSWKRDDTSHFATPYTIVIDPKMSFGTGHHETTRLCLRAIEQLTMTGRTVLDVGTGSGVLAIYALMRGAVRAVAIDTDEWSIDNAVENRALNDLSPEQLEVRAGRLDETVKPDEHFDIILANIHRNVLLALAKDLGAHLNADGALVLSGLLIYDADDVRRAYESEGFRFVRQDQENEWVALTFQH
jgi:ribosomal protein L11 methyltransferase